MKISTIGKIKELGLLAVVRGPSPDLTIFMVDALFRGGVTGIEITFSTPEAGRVVHSLSEKYGSQILLGMGTLTRQEQAEEAKQAGAQFLVSPHTDEALAEAMKTTELPFMMGALSPSEVVRSYNLGSQVVKLFPASIGGPAYLKALRSPFPYIPLMPTGGVNRRNLREWFEAGAFAVGVGSELCPPNLVNEGRFAEITEIARTFRRAVAAARTI
jgi:2-dehydro-3-deoxyphosphogluconate aldolase / (4S)-4-hydroxy-2-oxoglutarate aldolase